MPFPIQLLFVAILAIFHANFAIAEMAEPNIAYVDGNHPWNDCRPGLKRALSALTGLLISHPQYGSLPYNASRNCFLTIAVPLGYRIRLKALDFDVQGEWSRCQHEDTLHIFDHDRPLEPASLAAEQPLPIGGHTPGKILGEFCGKMPAQDGKVLAESSHNGLTLWWHSEAAKDGEGQDGEKARFLSLRTSTIHSVRALAQGYRLLWSSFRHSHERQCRPKGNVENESAEFKCGSFDSAYGKSSSPTECIPSALGCNSYADCSDGTDLDPQYQLQHGCEHIPNDPLSLLTSSGPKRLLLIAALVLLWLSLCLGCSCCLVHHRRQRLKKRKKRGINQQGDGGRKQRLNGEEKQNGSGSNQLQLEPSERGQMLHSHQLVVHHPDDLLPVQLPPPPLPPPSFSPPAIPSNRPPPAPANIGCSAHQRHFPQPAHGHAPHRNNMARQSASSSSHSSSQSQQHQLHQIFIPPPHPPPHLNSSGGGTTSTGTNSQNVRTSSGEYFYVQQPANANAAAINWPHHQQPNAQPQQHHLLL